MLVQSNVQRLFSVDDVIVLLEENTAWNLKIYYGRFKLTDKDGSECKANLIKKKKIIIIITLNDLPELD